MPREAGHFDAGRKLMKGKGVATLDDAEQLVLACPVCGQRFDGDEIECPRDRVSLVAVQSETFLPGSTFADRFELQELLGQGGMGSVYKARQRFTGQIVAIKMLHAGRDQQTYLRFKQEGKAASALKHPNIATVLDFGIADSGQAYLVMEFVEGMSLEQAIDTTLRMPVERCLKIFIQVCDALLEAHEHGIVHRDLKPSNIMLTQASNGHETIKLVDFGVAKMLAPDEFADGPKLTMTGEVFGSPAYMSPEQCTGRQIDHRSDIYAMGCVMYETLTRTPAFLGENRIEVMYKQMNEMPKDFRAVAPNLKINPDLEKIVFKALAKEPDQRFYSIAHLKEDLIRVSRNLTPLHLKGFRMHTSSGAILTRRAQTLIVVSVIGFLLTVGAFAFTFGAGVSFVNTHYLSPGDEADAENRYKEAEQLYSDGIKEAERIPFGDACVAVAVDRLGTFYQRHKEYDKAEQVFRRALKLRQGNYWTGKLELAEELNNVAYQLFMEKKLDEAAPLYEQAVKIFDAAKRTPRPQKFAACLRNYAALLKAQGKETEALQLEEKAAVVEKRPAEKNSPLDWFFYKPWPSVELAIEHSAPGTLNSYDTLPSELDQKAYPITADDIKFGEQQLEAMLRDRPQMSRFIRKGDSVWVWVSRQFAGEHTGCRYYWYGGRDLALFRHTIACNNGGRHFIAVAPRRTKDTADAEPNRMWAGFIFECFNIRNNDRFTRLYADIFDRKVSREDYINVCAILEYNALKESSNFYKTTWAPHLKALGITADSSFWRADLAPTYIEFITDYRRASWYLAYFAEQYDAAIAKLILRSRWVDARAHCADRPVH